MGIQALMSQNKKNPCELPTLSVILDKDLLIGTPIRIFSFTVYTKEAKDV